MVKSKINIAFVVMVYLTSMISSFGVGFTLAAYNVSGALLENQNGWTSTDTVLITSVGVLGMMLGALSTDWILPIGRLNSAHIANALVIASTVPMMFDTVWTFIIGRFLQGFGAGMFTVITGVYQNETAPQVDFLGTSINFGIVIGILLINTVQTLVLPDPTAEIVPFTNAWRWCFIVPGACAVIGEIMWLFIIKRDTPLFLKSKGLDAEALE